MDPLFVGLIVSVFNSDRSTRSSKIEVIGFQTVTNATATATSATSQDAHGQPAHEVHVSIPVTVRPADGPLSAHCLKALCDLPRLFTEEELLSFSNALDLHSSQSSQSSQTADSPSTRDRDRDSAASSAPSQNAQTHTLHTPDRGETINHFQVLHRIRSGAGILHSNFGSLFYIFYLSPPLIWHC